MQEFVRNEMKKNNQKAITYEETMAKFKHLFEVERDAAVKMEKDVLRFATDLKFYDQKIK